MDNRHQTDKMLITTAHHHLTDLLSIAFEHTPKARAIVVYDTLCRISTILFHAYQRALPEATFIDFHTQPPKTTRQQLEALDPFDLVALIQSTSFRMDAFRLRVELFKLKIKVIEHPHLGRMSEEEADAYVDSLAYDKAYYRGVGRALKAKIDGSQSGKVHNSAGTLYYDSPFESAKLNIGDYSEMPNTGGQFPLGEVFTEAQELRSVHGRVAIFGFGDVNYKLNIPPVPIVMIIHQGQVVDTENSIPEFDIILESIRRDEGTVWVRELGLGLNRAFTKERTVADTGTYERMAGIHLSLGAKHGIYGKPGFRRRDGKYHVDVFVDTDTFMLDEDVVYRDGAWCVE